MTNSRLITALENASEALYKIASNLNTGADPERIADFAEKHRIRAECAITSAKADARVKDAARRAAQ